MSRPLKRILLVAVILIGLLQFYQPARNKGNDADPATDFLSSQKVPPEVGRLVKTSCYDCHSDHTNYKWYDFVQPVRILVEDHINSGKRELNFSRWAGYSEKKQQRLLQSMQSQLKDGSMPLPSYTLMHGEAWLNKQQVRKLIDWIETKR